MATEVKDMLFMNKGDGENSYVKGSGYTRTVAEITQPIVYNAAQSFIRENGSSQFGVLNVADLGCAAGPNTFTVMSTVIESTVKNCSELGFQIPEIQFYLNDLVGNDFNTLFKGLSVIHEKYKNVVSCFAMGAPGSFHGRLFPKNSIHLLRSSYSLHWLSKVPKLTDEEGLSLNRGKIYISETSPPAVSRAYLTQFQQDFLSFLKERSSEMVCNGRMVLIIQGRQTQDPNCDKNALYVWEVLADAISNMVSQGLIDEEKLDSFNVPLYIASKDEVEDLLKKQDSFTTEFIDLISTKTIDMIRCTPESRAINVRAFTEPMISYQFGQEGMDKLYDKVTETIVEDSKHGNESTVIIALVLKKIK